METPTRLLGIADLYSCTKSPEFVLFLAASGICLVLVDYRNCPKRIYVSTRSHLLFSTRRSKAFFQRYLIFFIQNVPGQPVFQICCELFCLVVINRRFLEKSMVVALMLHCFLFGLSLLLISSATMLEMIVLDGRQFGRSHSTKSELKISQDRQTRQRKNYANHQTIDKFE